MGFPPFVAPSRRLGRLRPEESCRGRAPPLPNDDGADHACIEMTGYEATVVELAGARELPYDAARRARCDVRHVGVRRVPSPGRLS